jgi:excisionase family DNA binding protein
MTTQANEWMTVAEACHYLRITRATLYRWSNRGVIRLHHFGPRTTRVHVEDIRKLSGEKDTTNWTAMSQDAFAKDWDNAEDAVYDNWREIYGVPPG